MVTKRKDSFKQIENYLISNWIRRNDVLIAKYDASGNVLWAKQAGGQDIDASKNIAVASNGESYITGEFRGSATG